MSKITSFIFLFLLCATTSMAQNDKQLSYNNAEMLYHSGFFDKAEEYLLNEIHTMKGIHKSSAYRLLALCRLQTGDIETAKKYIDNLLKADPYYTPTLMDPQRFIDIVNEAKQQEAGITTASRQAESIDEAPVPVTVITEEMIRYSGASTLKELLCLYVPGMSQAEGMESNISMHGISGLTQEYILFLQDGHRLNGGSSNAEAPDYRNSLDKIQQIEVLRGPASSLYGNVALTAVVNIITYKGAKLNGGKFSATIGTQDTYGGSFVIGGGNNVVDITGWGSINSTSGFKHIVENQVLGGTTTLYSHGFNKRPSYDIGIKARWGDFSMTINSQRSKQVPYFNVLQLAVDHKIYTAETIGASVANYKKNENFNYDNYPNVNSNGPGTTRTNHHINLDYSHSFGKTDFQASGYVSLEHTNLYNALGDSVNSNILLELIKQTGVIDDKSTNPENIIPMITVLLAKQGTFINIDWENITFGGQAQLLTKYNFLGHGSAIFGMQYEHFALTEGIFNMGFGYNNDNMLTKGKVFNDGMEDIISAYTQLKHYFSPRFIVNAGLRYDHKIQYNDNRLNHFSPRLCLIYRINNQFATRASVNYSFVDAPYLYRALTINMFGGNNLQPETMKSFQAGITFHKPNTNFTAELSAYYNLISDLLTQTYGSKDGSGFQSSGRMRQTCVEGSAQYTSSTLLLNSNITWQKVVKSKKECNVVNGNRLGVPQLMGNIVAAWSPYVGHGTDFFGSGRLWLNTTISAQTATYYQNVDFLYAQILSSFRQKGQDLSNPYSETIKVDPQIVMSIGATYEWRFLDFCLTLKNITNNQYNVGSNMSGGVPHSGRQLLGKVTLKF